MTRTDFDKFIHASPENRRLFREEELILEATESVCRLMAAERITRAELAQRIGRSKAYVTQVLSGGRNMTLRTLADLADALESRVQLTLTKDQVPWVDSQPVAKDWLTPAQTFRSCVVTRRPSDQEVRNMEEPTESAA